MDKQPLNIVLVLKRSKEYSLHDVIRLSKHLHLNAGEKELQVYCIFDLIKSPIKLSGVTFLPMPNKWNTWWSKMNLFNPSFAYLRPYLYVDLDTAIVAPFTECLPSEEDEKKFIGLEDFYQKGKFASGMMWIPDTVQIDTIWKRWIENPKYHISKNRGDQDFLRKAIGEETYFFQQYCDNSKSFKPSRAWLRELPEGAAIIHFHGNPKIDHAAEKVEWVNNYINI